MSGDQDDPYTVGRNKPPKEHQFIKGRSGNPNGRPKKPRDPGAATSELLLHELILAEADRKLTLQENGRRVTRTVKDVILTKNWMTAASGNPYAQRYFLDKLAEAQARKEKERLQRLTMAYELKLDLQERRDKHVASGRDELTMRVHPSDIEIDGVTGEVRFYTPITDEEWAGRELLLCVLDDAHVILARSLVTLEVEDDDPLLQLGREFAIFRIHAANEGLPPRFRRPPPNHLRVRASEASWWLEQWAHWPSFQSRMRAKLGDLDPD